MQQPTILAPWTRHSTINTDMRLRPLERTEYSPLGTPANASSLAFAIAGSYL